MSLLYSIRDTSEVKTFEATSLIMAGGTDERAISLLQTIGKSRNNISQILLLQYDEFDTSCFNVFFPTATLYTIQVEDDAISFLIRLQDNQKVFDASSIIIDITAIRIPEMFTLIKYLKMNNMHIHLEVAYSTPMEYEFEEEPFISYHSYYGNLKLMDLIGYSGFSDDMAHSKMIIFLGFEGVLSEKVNEDINYNKLILVNHLPSFYEKYKDISVINNYAMLTTRHERISYIPANNPFDTYNFLDEHLDCNECACVAPLSTKPTALGVCIYALSHPALRVVYLNADEYNYHRTNGVHNTYLYTIPLDDI